MITGVVSLRQSNSPCLLTCIPNGPSRHIYGYSRPDNPGRKKSTMNCREKIIEQLKRTGDTGRLHWCYVYPGVAHSLLCQKSVGICPLNTITKDLLRAAATRCISHSICPGVAHSLSAGTGTAGAVLNAGIACCRVRKNDARYPEPYQIPA